MGIAGDEVVGEAKSSVRPTRSTRWCWRWAFGSGNVSAVTIEIAPSSPQLWDDVASAFGRRGVAQRGWWR